VRPRYNPREWRSIRSAAASVATSDSRRVMRLCRLETGCVTLFTWVSRWGGPSLSSNAVRRWRHRYSNTHRVFKSTREDGSCGVVMTPHLCNAARPWVQSGDLYVFSNVVGLVAAAGNRNEAIWQVGTPGYLAAYLGDNTQAAELREVRRPCRTPVQPPHHHHHHPFAPSCAACATVDARPCAS
jgi:hypothetical protein